MESEKSREFLDAEAGLPDDRAQRARFEIAARVDRHRHCARGVAGKCHDMMAADDTIDDKSRFLQSANNVFAAGGR